ncbi:hypothetical protein [Lysinibacillus yapensis]|uniref:hypothetical protein n=1 Tax=Ureibacillus yapensis TaxID=2304605 RepID=UPI0013146FF3|nr:hypothetical protein [Lysinibacillus yapensis]
MKRKEIEEKWNGQAALNNNIGSSTLSMNQQIAKDHAAPKATKTNDDKKHENKFS